MSDQGLSRPNSGYELCFYMKNGAKTTYCLYYDPHYYTKEKSFEEARGIIARFGKEKLAALLLISVSRDEKQPAIYIWPRYRTKEEGLKVLKPYIEDTLESYPWFRNTAVFTYILL
ncbi:hypothetical protein MYX06_01810 [Patescibacteria group bacterium AH-259-L05]|nr:hypothetical protein [Patescibacteria group bacterium AH-259-L05]